MLAFRLETAASIWMNHLYKYYYSTVLYYKYFEYFEGTSELS
jgi:hypothetical protein